MEKKKSSYEAKKEKLLEIKKQIEWYYDIQRIKEEQYKKGIIVYETKHDYEIVLEMIWMIVKDEKAK